MATGTATTYQLSAGIKLDVEDVIWLLSPFDVPLLGTQGSDGRTALSQDTCFERKVEWLDEQLLLPSTTLGGNAATTDTYVTVAGTTARLGFEENDVILVGTERMRVTGLGTTSNTLTVTRAWAGTTKAAHTSGAPVKGVGMAAPEGADAGTAAFRDRTDRYNYTEIFGPRTVQVSGTENAVQKFGLAGTEFDHQVANRVKEIYVALEQAILYGKTYTDGVSRRTMGGLVTYISTNIDSSTTSLSDTALLTQLQKCFDAGGTPDRVVTGSKQKRNLSSLHSTLIRYAQGTNVRGQVVDWYDSDFGRQLVVLDRWCRTSDLFIIERDNCTVMTLRPIQFEMLAKTGDSTKGMVVGEKSARIRRQQWMARFSALT